MQCNPGLILRERGRGRQRESIITRERARQGEWDNERASGAVDVAVAKKEIKTRVKQLCCFCFFCCCCSCCCLRFLPSLLLIMICYRVIVVVVADSPLCLLFYLLNCFAMAAAAIYANLQK